MDQKRILSLTTLALVALALISSAPTIAASPSDFASASGSIATAYLAVSRAQQEGGNVSSLVSSLNVAVGLLTAAQSENSSDPVKASADLQNATALAQQVTAAAPAVGQAGSVARQTREEASIGSAVVIVAIAAVVYAYGEKIYHRLWIRLYGRYMVRKTG